MRMPGKRSRNFCLMPLLMLFVGGDSYSPAPIARIVLRLDEGVGTATRGIYQVMRHRVMRGDTIVDDLGWRPMPSVTGLPELSLRGQHLMTDNVAPLIKTEAPGFASLKDMRVLVDVQSAVFDDEARVLGGVNWGIEFRITGRGKISWQLRPDDDYDPVCGEVQRVMSAVLGGADGDDDATG